MIGQFKEQVDSGLLQRFQDKYRPTLLERKGRHLCVISAQIKALDEEFLPLFSALIKTDSDIQLASRSFDRETTSVTFGEHVIGGDSGNMVFIAGPCSVESREQLWTVCERLRQAGVSCLRGGAFKPRTTPYGFQGLGLEGLALLAGARAEFGLTIVSEVRDSTHVQEVIEAVDVVQIGAKAMYDHGILRACGHSKKPILLKRGFGSTLQEFVQAAEFILSTGNEQVVLCERGIRTFETKTRFTLDLCGVAYLKEHINLPVIVDPSHAMGFRYGVPGLALAATAMGVDGLLIEAHPTPDAALSDAAQQLDLDTLAALRGRVQAVAEVVGRHVV